MAYGGKLKYTVDFYALDGTGTSNFEPQVLMKGGFTSKKIIYVEAPAAGIGVKQEEEILMVEVRQTVSIIELLCLNHLMQGFLMCYQWVP